MSKCMNYLSESKKMWSRSYFMACTLESASWHEGTIFTRTFRWLSKISKSVLSTSLSRLEISCAPEKRKHEAEEWWTSCLQLSRTGLLIFPSSCYMFRHVIPSSHNIRMCWQGKSVSSVLFKLNSKLPPEVCFLSVPHPSFWGELLIWVHKCSVATDFYKTSSPVLAPCVSVSHMPPAKEQEWTIRATIWKLETLRYVSSAGEKSHHFAATAAFSLFVPPTQMH